MPICRRCNDDRGDDAASAFDILWGLIFLGFFVAYGIPGLIEVLSVK